MSKFLLWDVYHGLFLAWDIGWRFIELEVDSKIITNWFSKKKDLVLAGTSLVKVVLFVLARDWVVCPRHIYREANKVADWLANQAFTMDSPCLQVLDKAPVGCFSLVFANLCSPATHPD